MHRIAQLFASSVGKTPVIRRLTTTEISQLWVVIPFDIEEPVYLLENGSRHFVICLNKDASTDNYRIWWVDVLTEYDYGQPNKVPRPTPITVTPPAGQPSRQP